MGRLRDKVRLHDGLIYDRHPYGPGPGRDPQLLTQGLADPSPLQIEGMEALSDVDLQVFRHKVDSVVDEAREVYSALSISEGVIVGDLNTSVLTAEGDPAVVATGIYFHSLLNYAPIRYILEYYRSNHTVGLKEGDIYFFNDPNCGGVHTFDMFVCTPIFADGELIAWAQVGSHQGEVGSNSPGGFSPKATTRWEEGFHVPALRIGENWELRQDILDFMLNSVRNPFVFASDLKARVATCRRIRDRMVREAERRGAAAVAGGLRKILSAGAEQARHRLAALNDGIFRGVIFNDTVGLEPALVRVPTTVIKEGSNLTVLVQGVSPENWRGPMHATWHLMRAAMGVYFFTYLFRGLPPNIGLFEPIEVLVEGPSVANATEEVAKGEGSSIASLNVQSLHVIGSKMLFDSEYNSAVCAPFSRNVLVNIYAGKNSYGYRVANATPAANAGGQGARLDLDGEHACGFFWASVTDTGEAEEIDSRLPPLTLARRIDKDFHGYGRFRGGSPMVEISMAPPECGCSMTSWGSADRLSHNPGLFGGYSAPPNPRFVIRDSNILELMKAADPAAELSQFDLANRRRVDGTYQIEASSQTTDSFDPGDLFVYSIGGGGGYGDVLERPPESVADDVRANILTTDVARDVYGVVLNEVTQSADLTATEDRRAEIRDERRRRGMKFDEFVPSWRAKRPSDDKLKHYGNWPEPRLEKYEKPFWGIYD